jgi:hypothetical protein
MLLVDHQFLPVGVGMPLAVSLLAMLERVLPSSRYQAKICCTIAAAYPSRRSPAGSRGLWGSTW